MPFLCLLFAILNTPVFHYPGPYISKMSILTYSLTISATLAALYQESRKYSIE